MKVCVCRSVSQPVLTQPPSLSVSLGSSPRLTCTLSGGFRVGSNDMYWFQQNQGALPRTCGVSTQTQISTTALGSPGASVVPKMHQAKQGICPSPDCRLRTRLTISELQLMALGAATVPHRVSDHKELSPGTRDLVPETLVLRSFCAGPCRGLSPVGRPVLEGEE